MPIKLEDWLFDYTTTTAHFQAGSGSYQVVLLKNKDGGTLLM